jgi:hypothetical protein
MRKLYVVLLIEITIWIIGLIITSDLLWFINDKMQIMLFIFASIFCIIPTIIPGFFSEWGSYDNMEE